MPVTALYREMGSWLIGLKQKTSGNVKTKCAVPKKNTTDRVLTNHISFARTKLDPSTIGHLERILAIQTDCVACVFLAREPQM